MVHVCEIARSILPLSVATQWADEWILLAHMFRAVPTGRLSCFSAVAFFIDNCMRRVLQCCVLYTYYVRTTSGLLISTIVGKPFIDPESLIMC
jgi:hypothetical protein